MIQTTHMTYITHKHDTVHIANTALTYNNLYLLQVSVHAYRLISFSSFHSWTGGDVWNRQSTSYDPVSASGLNRVPC